MPQLSNQQLRHLKNLLDAREMSLRMLIHAGIELRTEEAYHNLSSLISENTNPSFIDPLVEVDNSMIHLRLSELHDIDITRERIIQGIYGECIKCGDDIDYARLKATPTARRCIHCQSAYERASIEIPPSFSS